MDGGKKSVMQGVTFLCAVCVLPVYTFVALTLYCGLSALTARIIESGSRTQIPWSDVFSHDFISELPRALADGFRIPVWSLPRDECPPLDIYDVLFKELGYDGFFCLQKHSGRLEPL
jgi:hypothetical protein